MDHFQRENLVLEFESFPFFVFSDARHSVKIFFAYTTLVPACAKIPILPQAKIGVAHGGKNHRGVFCIVLHHASGPSIIYLGLINFIRPLIHLSGPHEVCKIILTGHSVWYNRIGVRVQG